MHPPATRASSRGQAPLIEDEIARRGIRLVGRGPERFGPCPKCGGRDRFSINTSKQLWNCRGCGRGGDVIDLVRHVDGVGYGDAIRLLGGTVRQPIVTARSVKPAPAQDQEQDTKNIERALALWDAAAPIAGTLAEAYLERRGLEPPPGDDVLRFSGGCPFDGSRFSCMLALYRDIATDEPRAIQRTAIGPGGIKIGRLSLGPVGGAAVKIDADENVELGLHVGEGLETCLAARMLGFRPVWSLGNDGAIRRFQVLSGIEALTILVDNDVADRNGRRAGQQAAEECKQRWREAGREVTLVLPKKPGADVADYFGDNNGR